MRLLATGFGPFPGAPENPTGPLMRALAEMPAEAFGAGAFRAAVLPTEYSGSWAVLDQLAADFAPDIVVHFGMSARIAAIHVERTGRNRLDPAKPDACGRRPAACIVEGGAETLASTFPAAAIVARLAEAGFAARLSDDAGSYVCNATLYRSLQAAPPGRRVGFVHVPPEACLSAPELRRAAGVILRAAIT